MITDGIGLYVHVPFCVSKCKYCDFASFGGITGDVRARYVARLVEEIKGYKKEERITVNTLFFGGGTPSLLTEGELNEIFSAIRDSFILTPDAEITVEANPKTLSREGLEVYKRLGVNRLSIGLQSIHKNELKMLGRIHDFSDFKESLALAREAGFDNINVDLMYAIPEQTVESLEKTVREVIALSPTHISAYSLIIEEGTPFYEMRERISLPSEDEELLMYRTLAELLAEGGYLHYEISNYAKAGYECRHNLKYWRDEHYIGVGLAAYSYFNGERFGNTRIMDEYLSDNYTQYGYREALSQADEEFEYAMLRLRLREGISIEEYRARFSKDFTDGRMAALQRYEREGLLVFQQGRIRLTERGFYLSNAILAEIL